MLHSHLIIATANLYSHSVIFEPSVRLRLIGELADSSRQPEVGRNHSGPDGSAETLGTGNVHSAASRIISVMTFSMHSVPVDQTLNKNKSRIKAWLSWVDWYPSLTAVGAPVILPLRHV